MEKLGLLFPSVASIHGEMGLFQNLQSFNNLISSLVWLPCLLCRHYSQISQLPPPAHLLPREGWL